MTCRMMWYSSQMPLPPSMSLATRAISKALPHEFRLIKEIISGVALVMVEWFKGQSQITLAMVNLTIEKCSCRSLPIKPFPDEVIIIMWGHGICSILVRHCTWIWMLSVSVCVCVCVCACMCVRTCMKYMHVCAYMHVCVCVCVCMCAEFARSFVKLHSHLSIREANKYHTKVAIITAVYLKAKYSQLCLLCPITNSTGHPGHCANFNFHSLNI